MRPGTDHTLVESASGRQVLTDTGTAFFVGPAERGPTVPVLYTSYEKAQRRLGGRVAYSSLLDSLARYFAVGGSRAYVNRVVGEAAVAASVELDDAEAAAAITVEAVDVGEYGNSLRVQVVAGSGAGLFVLVISHVDDGELERSPDLADNAAAVSWAETRSEHVRVSALAGDNPAVVAATPLAGGDDDHAAIDDDSWDVAATGFDPDLGPGQILAPGLTSVNGRVNVILAAKAGNRVPMVDGPNTTDPAAIKADRAALIAALDPPERRHASYWGNWITGAGPAGTTITTPGSAVEAGLIAKSDRSNSPNVPAAGENGILPDGFDVAVQFDEATHEELNALGCNLFRRKHGTVRAYGYRSLALKEEDENWWQWNHSRLFMAIVARGLVVAERFVLAEFDGKRRKLSKFEGDLLAEAVLPFWGPGSLYGNTVEEAARVDATSTDANPDEQLAEGIVRGLVFVRMSPMAEWVRLEIAKLPITEPIPA
jgi:hypothetical protein